MSRPAVILASWGNPFNWGRVKYRIVHVGERSSSYCESRSISSLDLITRYYREEKFDPYVIVLVQESLLAVKPKEGKECVVIDDDTDEKDYMWLVAELEKCMENYIDSETGIKENSSRVEVKVMPSIGEYIVRDMEKSLRVKWKISSDLLASGKANPFDHYYSNALIEITRFLLNSSKDPGDNETKVVLDLTHGLNYAGHAFYRASLLAVRLYSVVRGVNVDVEVYNSEPYSSNVEELGIHRIRREVITPKKAASRLVYTFVSYDPKKLDTSFHKLLIMSREMDTEKKKELGKEQHDKLSEYVGWLFRSEGDPGIKGLAYMAVASPFFGAPLLVLQTGHWIQIHEASREPENTLKDLMEYLSALIRRHDTIRVTRDNGSLTINYRIVLDRILLSSLVSSVAMTGFTLNSYRQFCAREGCCTVFCNSPKRLCVSTDCLNSNDVAKYIVGPVYYVVSNELSCLKQGNKCKGNPLASRIEYVIRKREYQEVLYCDKGALHKTIDERVFQAHAGLNNDIIEVRALYSNDSIKPCIQYASCSKEKGGGLIEDLAKVSKGLLYRLYKALKPEYTYKAT